MTETVWGRIAKLETPAKHFLTALAVEMEQSLFFHNEILPKKRHGKKDSEPSNLDGESRFGRNAVDIQREMEQELGIVPRVMTGPEFEEYQRHLRLMQYAEMVERGEEIEFIPAETTL